MTKECPRCGDDLTEYHEDDLVWRKGDDRPYCSGECVVRSWRASQKAGEPTAVYRVQRYEDGQWDSIGLPQDFLGAARDRRDAQRQARPGLVLRIIKETTSVTVVESDGEHVGGNAENCAACAGTNPPYPFICPGPAAPEPVPCNWVAARWPHVPHTWEPQPDMDPVPCLGYTPGDTP